MDPVPGELSGLGKVGEKIEQAREGVLDILRSENGCSEWFETKEANSAGTFQTLHFSLDQRGPQDILETRQRESQVTIRQPYVARSTQDAGSDATIMLNANGAFFRPQGKVEKSLQEGGPLQLDGTHLLNVGSYIGDTPQARMLTLMHEFGHIINLLPEDADDLDGKSVQNTNEVLSHCRPEIEAHSRPAKQSAKP